MSSRFEAYRMKDGSTRLGEAYFNAVFQDVDLRLSKVELLQDKLDNSISQFESLGLKRIDEVLGNAVGQIMSDINVLKSSESELAKLLEKTRNDLFTAASDVVPILCINYSERSVLRTISPSSRQVAAIDGLGLFVFNAGSTEPDDDESCFAATGGGWLLECPSWDLIEAWQEVQSDADRPIFARVKCGISSVAANSSARFSIRIPGVHIGDIVIATPPSELGETTSSSQRLSFVAYVSAPDTVSIRLSNPTDTSAIVNKMTQGEWVIAVLKEK